MNWEMVGAIGEILGAAGVVITLGYLASQIRANRRQGQLRAGREAMDRTTDFVKLVASDGELADIWRRGMLDPGTLEEEERVRLGALLLHLTYLWERMYFLALEGGVDGYLHDTIVASRREIVLSPGYRRWFEGRRGWFSPEVRGVVEEEISAGGAYRPMGWVGEEDPTTGTVVAPGPD